MRKNLSKVIKLSTVSAIAAALPIVLIVACGELSANTNSPALEKAQGEAFVDRDVKLGAVVTPISTPTILSWVKQAALTANLVSAYEEPKYSASYYASPTLALSSDERDWSSELPSSTSSVISERHLWVRLVHKNNPALSVALDLTQSSSIRLVQANPTEDAASAFLVNTLAPGIEVVAASSNPGSLVWKSPTSSLPPALALSYEAPQFAQGTAFQNERVAANDSASLWSSDLPTSTNSRSDKRLLWARLKPKTANLNALAINLTNTSALANVHETKVFLELSARKYLDEDLSLRLRVNLASSRYPSVTWNAYDLALPDALYDYYDLEFTDSTQSAYLSEAEAAQGAAPWGSSQPPIKIESQAWFTNPSSRKLWVRLRSRDLASYANVAADYTAITGIDKFPA